MKKNKLFAIIVLALFFVFIILREYKKKTDLQDNQKQTIGKVLNLISNYQARYTLTYEYFVNGKRFTGRVGVSPFKCDDGKKACIGHEFKVYYSSKTPKNSRIDLGKYEKFKTSIEF